MNIYIVLKTVKFEYGEETIGAWENEKDAEAYIDLCQDKDRYYISKTILFKSTDRNWTTSGKEKR